MLSYLLAPFIVAAVLQQTPGTIVQKSTGWCSPNIANVVGNVTVNCIGVDPRALQRLNAQLDRKNLQLSDKIREADEWTARYKELEARLSRAGDDSVLSRHAEEYLHQGELEKAGTTLDQILGSEDKQTDQTAANHFNRALFFELQFLPLDALPHLRKAYQLAVANENPSEQAKYGIEYGRVLLDENDFTHAEPVMLASLENARQLAKTNPAANQPDVATTLNNLAILYSATQRMKEAETELGWFCHRHVASPACNISESPTTHSLTHRQLAIDPVLEVKSLVTPSRKMTCDSLLSGFFPPSRPIRSDQVPGRRCGRKCVGG